MKPKGRALFFPKKDKPKPTDEEIAREARDEIRDYFDKPLFLSGIAEDRDEVFVIILDAIKKAKE